MIEYRDFPLHLSNRTGKSFSVGFIFPLAIHFTNARKILFETLF